MPGLASDVRSQPPERPEVLAGRASAAEVTRRVRERLLGRTLGASPGLESVLYEIVYREQHRV